MAGRTRNIQSAVIDPEKFGVSFSSKQCRNFKIEESDCLKFLLDVVGFRRFRLMSYWDESEKSVGQFDFTNLDNQIQQIQQAGGVITLCLGARQPRWPENHWPKWAWESPPTAREEALLKYIEVVVERYKKFECIVSWQLENEALLKSFGTRSEVNRSRLRREFKLIQKLDSSRPVIMSTSNAWGIPLRRPIPNIVGFSLYTVAYGSSNYERSTFRPWIFRLRALLIALTSGRPAFIHELQTEPWGPKAIWEMSPEEQNKSMDTTQIESNIQLAKKTNLYPIDLWGAEWWYSRHKQKDDSIYKTVIKNLTSEI